jgi:ribosome-associated protein YbcJ (S4-like RNA binding protein)
VYPALWDKYSEEEITVNQLLKKCGKIYGGQ